MYLSLLWEQALSSRLQQIQSRTPYEKDLRKAAANNLKSGREMTKTADEHGHLYNNMKSKIQTPVSPIAKFKDKIFPSKEKQNLATISQKHIEAKNKADGHLDTGKLLSQTAKQHESNRIKFMTKMNKVN